MYCQNCGTKIKEGADVCLNCGHRIKKVEHKTMTDDKNFKINDNNIPFEYKPISMWGYFGYEILFMIPVIGFILLLILAFGGTRNKNLKNFARSYFCLAIIIGLLFIMFFVITAGITGTISSPLV